MLRQSQGFGPLQETGGIEAVVEPYSHQYRIHRNQARPRGLHCRQSPQTSLRLLVKAGYMNRQQDVLIGFEDQEILALRAQRIDCSTTRCMISNGKKKNKRTKRHYLNSMERIICVIDYNTLLAEQLTCKAICASIGWVRC
jgi:hypothetical protein